MASPDRRLRTRHTFSEDDRPAVQLVAAGAAGTSLPARVLDLSPEGVGVLVNADARPPAVGTSWSIGFFPPGAETGRAALTLAGVVMSANRLSDGWRCGFRLIAPIAETAEELLDALWTLLLS